MSDIELVIKIPKAYYELVLERCKEPVLLNAFKCGTPLPKGHGRLIDEEQIPGDGGWDFSDRLMLTPTIIEKDGN